MNATIRKILRVLLIAIGLTLFAALMFITGGDISDEIWNIPTSSFRYRLYDYFFVQHKMATIAGFAGYGLVVAILFKRELVEWMRTKNGDASYQFRLAFYITIASIAVVVATLVKVLGPLFR